MSGLWVRCGWGVVGRIGGKGAKGLLSITYYTRPPPKGGGLIEQSVYAPISMAIPASSPSSDHTSYLPVRYSGAQAPPGHLHQQL